MKAAPGSECALPITRSMESTYALSWVIAIGVAGASVAGLLLPSAIYPSQELRRSFVPNDVMNLCVAVPFLLVSAESARRGGLTGLLCLPGALLYAVYNYLAYAFALPISPVWIVDVLIAALGLWAAIALTASIDGRAIRERLRGRVPGRIAGGILAALGVLFLLQALNLTMKAAAGSTVIGRAERAVAWADMLITPVWIATGTMLLRQRAAGYVLGLGLLAQASMLFVGLIGFLMLQPLIFGGRIGFASLAMVAGMSLVCFVPFALFMAGVHSADR